MLTACFLRCPACGSSLSFVYIAFILINFDSTLRRLGQALFWKGALAGNFISLLRPICSSPFHPPCRPLTFICHWSRRNTSQFQLLFTNWSFAFPVNIYWLFFLLCFQVHQRSYCFPMLSPTQMEGLVDFSGLFSFACSLGFLGIPYHLILWQMFLVLLSSGSRYCNMGIWKD